MNNVQLKFQKLKAHYPDLCRIESFNKDKFWEVYGLVTDKPFEIIQYSGELLNYIALAKLIKDGKYQSYMFMNAYELIDIYLGNKEEIKCISDIEASLVIVYLGYSEFENKRQSDVIEQLFEIQRINRRKMWVLYRGTTMDSKYPKVVDLFRMHGYPVTQVKKVVNPEGEDEF